MQAIKEKLTDMSAMRKAKAEAKEEEKEEKELAKARVEVAHEVRLAREAEAAMDLHVNKAADKAVDHERKYAHHVSGGRGQDTYGEESYTHESYAGWNPTSPRAGAGYSPDAVHGGGAHAYGRDTGGFGSATTAGIDGYAGNRAGGPPTNNNLL